MNNGVLMLMGVCCHFVPVDLFISRHVAVLGGLLPVHWQLKCISMRLCL